MTDFLPWKTKREHFEDCHFSFNYSEWMISSFIKGEKYSKNILYMWSILCSIFQVINKLVVFIFGWTIVLARLHAKRMIKASTTSIDICRYMKIFDNLCTKNKTYSFFFSCVILYTLFMYLCDSDKLHLFFSLLRFIKKDYGSFTVEHTLQFHPRLCYSFETQIWCFLKVFLLPAVH